MLLKENNQLQGENGNSTSSHHPAVDYCSITRHRFHSNEGQRNHTGTLWILSQITRSEIAFISRHSSGPCHYFTGCPKRHKPTSSKTRWESSMNMWRSFPDTLYINFSLHVLKLLSRCPKANIYTFSIKTITLYSHVQLRRDNLRALQAKIGLWAHQISDRTDFWNEAHNGL